MWVFEQCHRVPFIDSSVKQFCSEKLSYAMCFFWLDDKSAARMRLIKHGWHGVILLCLLKYRDESSLRSLVGKYNKKTQNICFHWIQYLTEKGMERRFCKDSLELFNENNHFNRIQLSDCILVYHRFCYI